MPQAEPILHTFQNDTALPKAKGGENPDRCGGQYNTRLARNSRHRAYVCSSWATEEWNMPVLLLWAVPAVIVVGGVGYYLVRAVH